MKEPKMVQRGTILPIAEYDDGSVGWAWPGLLHAPAAAWQRMVDTSMTPDLSEADLEQMSRDSFDAAGLAMTGGLTAAGAGMVDNALGSAGGRLAKGQAPQGIRAYHGSPHDFDRFSLDKIGTGEGAQAYGHGLYFADSEDVARNYRTVLTADQGHEINFRGEPFDVTNEGLMHRTDGYILGEDGDKALSAAAKAYSRWPEGTPDDHLKVLENFDLPPDKLEAAQQYLTEFSRRDPGRMYEVNIRANPEDFLDWDKPLSQQSEAVRDAFVQRAMDAAQRGALPKSDTKIIQDLLARDVPASEFYTRTRNVFGRSEDASQALREAGIPGIRYLDGMSRGAGEGSSNYVVFDDELIDILRKYANAPTGAAVPLGMEAQQDEQTDPQTVMLANLIRRLKGGE